MTWWQEGVVYQIYPRSFLDTDGDGIGDLRGIAERLGYLADLGVDAVWLSPIYRSPMADFGYDVADHCAVDPVFGTLQDFDELVLGAHARGIKVLLDWVPNHTSSQHPWFLQSRASRSSPKRDWYVWRDQPNNWVATFSDDPAWTYDEATGQYYLHHFLPEQPDLNWGNPEVVEAMHAVLRFWLDRGVDGFRADVVHLIGKDPLLPDDPPEVAGRKRPGFHDHPSTHPLLRDIRGVLDAYDGDRMVVGEVNLEGSARIAPYYGKSDELHLAFNFEPLFAQWEARRWRELITDIEASFGQVEAWPTWVLSNHDQPRHRTRYGSDARARAAAVLLLTLRGTPFLYAGEELGLEDAEVPPDRVVDPGGRDGCRAPIPWDGSASHGWASNNPWLPWPPGADVRNARAQGDEAGSMLRLYRGLLAVRRNSEALRRGEFRFLDGPDEVLVYERATPEDTRVVVVNFAERSQAVHIDGSWRVLVDTDADGERWSYAGEIGPLQALVLQPERTGLGS